MTKHARLERIAAMISAHWTAALMGWQVYRIWVRRFRDVYTYIGATSDVFREPSRRRAARTKDRPYCSCHATEYNAEVGIVHELDCALVIARAAIKEAHHPKV